MKGKKVILSVAGALLLTGGLAACGGKNNKNNNNPSQQVEPGVSVALNESAVHFLEVGETFQLVANCTYVGGAKASDYTFSWASSDPSVATVDQNGLVTYKDETHEGTATITLTVDGKNYTCTVGYYELASGYFDYSNKGFAEKAKITAILEKWAVKNKLTGLTIYEDGGYQMMNPRVERGAPTYIQGYGFGTLAEGRLTGPLAGETEEKYKMYYHSYSASDPAYLLSMNDDGSEVSEFTAYCTGAYFDTIMNEERNSFIWWNADLSTVDLPIAVNPDADGASNEFLIPVKTGKNLKYSTLSTVYSSFNNREVALDDYLTPYKIYYTAAFNVVRNAEVKDSANGSLKGGEAYKKASANGINEEAFKQLGVSAEHNDTYGDCLRFKLNTKETPFWAAYYLDSNFWAPVPMDFLTTLGGGDVAEGVKLWGGFNSGATLSPVDTWLSTGPYVPETWNKDSLVTFKRNPNYISRSSEEEKATKRPSSYNIEGVHIDILPALLGTDLEAALKMFTETGSLDACGIPSTRLNDFINDPRTVQIPGATTTKLNLNTCTQAQWDELFGEYGSITQTSAANAWQCEPAMANKHFVDGLSFAIDRKALATAIGVTPSANYFGGSYFADPENVVYYNDTQGHIDAMAELLEGTEYGYSLEKAKEAFKLACEELIADGVYQEGDTITIEFAFQSDSNRDVYFNPIKSDIEAAFNACGGGLNIELVFWAPQVWSDVYYKKMMVGQFDIGFGGVEGNSLDPLNFLEVLKSDNSSNFTLNWGIDTNTYAEIPYDGKLWTFDALWTCADHGGYVEEGCCVPTFDAWCGYDDVADDYIVSRDADGNFSFELHYLAADVEGLKTELSSFCLYGTTDENYSDYAELYFYADGTTDLNYDDSGLDESTLDTYWVRFEEAEELGEYGEHVVTVTISAACIDVWLDVFPPEDLYDQGIDVYYVDIVDSVPGSEAFYATIWGGDIPEIPLD